MPTGDGSKQRALFRWALYLIPALLIYGLAYYALSSYGRAPSASQSAVPQTDHTVTYTGSGFSPGVLSVRKGAVVTFTNASSRTVRVASNVHPIHDLYPTTGGCISSTFDSCAPILPGHSWSFTFDIAGTWGYHNHLSPSEGGTIVVQ